jgi:hypothetical protein
VAAVGVIPESCYSLKLRQKMFLQAAEQLSPYFVPSTLVSILYNALDMWLVPDSHARWRLSL